MSWLHQCARCGITCINAYPANGGQVKLCGFCVDLSPGDDPAINGYLYDAETRVVRVAGAPTAPAEPRAKPAGPVTRQALDDAWAEQGRVAFPHDVPLVAPAGSRRQTPVCVNCQSGKRVGPGWRCAAGQADTCAPYGEASGWSFRAEEPVEASC